MSVRLTSSKFTEEDIETIQDAIEAIEDAGETIEELTKTVETLNARARAVTALHSPTTWQDETGMHFGCNLCLVDGICPTVKAILGESE